jgi:hypothetical protein
MMKTTALMTTLVRLVVMELSFASFLECLLVVLVERVHRQQDSRAGSRENRIIHGRFEPEKIAIAVPNMTSKKALASAVQRSQTPNIRRTPSDVSATVAAPATKGMIARGKNEFTSPAY